MLCVDFGHKCEYCKKIFTLKGVELKDEGIPIDEDGDFDQEDGKHEPYYVFSHDQKCDHCGTLNTILGDQNDIPSDAKPYQKR